MMDPKYLALASHFSLVWDSEDDGSLESQIEEIDNDTYKVDSQPGEYRVLTSEEKEDAIREALDQYIDDVILPEIPQPYCLYFNRDSWKRDVAMAGEEDSSIAPYDGDVHEVMVDGHWYYIIRVE